MKKPLRDRKNEFKNRLLDPALDTSLRHFDDDARTAFHAQPEEKTMEDFVK